MKEKIDYYFVGILLLFLTVSNLLLSSLCWLLGFTINSLLFPLSFLITIVLIGIKKRSTKDVLYYTFLIATLLFISILINSFIMDISCDGQLYHQPGVYALSHDWNPIYNSQNSVISNEWASNIWIEHYCKGMETISACIVAFTGNLESGKAINLILLVSLFFIIYDFLSLNFNKYLNNKKIILYSCLLTFSPTMVGQLFTYYIDLCGYYSFLVLAILLYRLIVQNDNFTYLPLACCIVLAGAVKYNMFFWSAYLIFISILYLLFCKRYFEGIKIAVFSLIIAVFTIFIIDYNPFVTNYIDHNNPIYPMGSSEIDGTAIVTKNCQPIYMQNESRFLQVLQSIASRPQNDVQMTQYVHPYTDVFKSIAKSAGEGPCLGGGGFFFFECILISILIMFMCRKNKKFEIALFCYLLLAITPFILPLGSNIRYVPFIYALPILSVLFSEILVCDSFTLRLLRKLLIVLLLCNITLSTAMTLLKQGIKQLTWTYYIDSIKKHPNETTYIGKNWSLNYKVKGENTEPILMNKDSLFTPHKYFADPYTKINREILDKEVAQRNFIGKHIAKQ